LNDGLCLDERLTHLVHSGLDAPVGTLLPDLAEDL
jgi:hypothetical protein